MGNQAKIIAVCGKGGVGKTSFSAMMVKQLSQKKDKKILAIDADPAVGLATALGVPVHKTVDDIRKGIINQVQKGLSKAGLDMSKQLDYEVFESLVQQDGISLLAIGRPEDEGCFCKVNNLLKDIIRDLAEKFDIVVIDGEAGIEQINRRVMKKVDHLVLVSDTSAKAVNVTATIAHVASDNRAVDFCSIGLVLNRVWNAGEVEDIKGRTNLDIYGWIAEDDLIRDMDFRGQPLTAMPESSATLVAISSIIERMNIDH
jgi:CO dehydrogenase maturation factor